MSSTSLKTIEIENFGRFYDPAKLIFNDRVNAVVLEASSGKSTFVNALEFLSETVLEGNIRNSERNICRTYVNKPKNFIRIEILLEISDATHSGIYRYGISVTDIGVLSEYLLKENTGRRIFYRYKNDIDLIGLNTENAEYVKTFLAVDIPVLHLLKGSKKTIFAYFIRFFEKIWTIRAGGIKYRLSGAHLFKSGFFTRRSNILKCCEFLRCFDLTVVDLIKVPGTSKVMVIHKNLDGYEYPVALAKESDSFIKLLALFRAIDTLSPYGGTILWDAGDISSASINAERLMKSISAGVSVIFFFENDRFCTRLNINKAKYVGF